MKILLDENVPRKLRYRFGEGYHVATVKDMGWDSKKNGDLLQVLLTAGFEAFITGDGKMRYEQNWKRYPIPVLVLQAHDNTYETYLPFVPQILALLASGAAPGPHIISSAAAPTR